MDFQDTSRQRYTLVVVLPEDKPGQSSPSFPAIRTGLSLYGVNYSTILSQFISVEPASPSSVGETNKVRWTLRLGSMPLGWAGHGVVKRLISQPTKKSSSKERSNNSVASTPSDFLPSIDFWLASKRNERTDPETAETGGQEESGWLHGA